MEKRLFEVEMIRSHDETGKTKIAACKIAAEDIDSAISRAKELVAENGYLLVSKIEQVAIIEVI